MSEEQVICPKCNKEAPWVPNEVAYGNRFGKNYMCYFCKECDTYVGCHNNTKEPLGTMADKELRNLRMQTHKVFDLLWKNGKMNRNQAYQLLEEKFGREIHIGSSDVETCKKIIDLLKVG
jgi:hypothetical protein